MEEATPCGAAQASGAAPPIFRPHSILREKRKVTAAGLVLKCWNRLGTSLWERQFSPETPQQVALIESSLNI
jgi:hypothetical protein